MNLPGRAFLYAACLLAGAAGARADIILSVGYYDLAPCCGNSNPLPNPWYGSPNTSFLGSAAEATSSDPDESAILLTNTGTATVTLNQGFTVTSGSNAYTLWDSLIGAGGFSILPGKSVILGGTTANAFDGSDIGLTDSSISLKLNGKAYSAVDSGSILHGFPAFDETEPWTQIGDFLHNGSTAPEPAALALVGTGLLGLIAGVRRRKS